LLRVWNALAYPSGWGFDEIQNWRYVERLTRSWALPAPDADWSTAHPPLFYYAGALAARAFPGSAAEIPILVIRLGGVAAGLATAGLAALAVRRLAGDPGRALLAAGVVLLLPAQLVLCAMVNEEVLAAALVSAAAVAAALDLARPTGPRPAAGAALAGLAGGLAWLTKASALGVVAATAAAYAADGLRRHRSRAGLGRAALLLAVASASGGWFYARNVAVYGYVYPHDLAVHARMHSMPPGERHALDYLRVPPATFTHPEATDPSLLRSVPGTTYASFWFDAHRHFLPRDAPAVDRAGALVLVLALLPTAALALGLLRGARRAWAAPGGPDTVFVGLVAVTLAAYALFTWRNPWFAAVKGSYLLGLAVPVAFYASGPLADWSRGRGARARAVQGALALLGAAIAVCFTFGVFSFAHLEYPGLRWGAVR
jgi:hypothetical protein